ncbi:MAG TPA: hypothetical protein PKM43_01075 [Verrucomicrobiota bacterium]|nr:hypothetical protein [Verrucomicrobiota bacterium]
MKVNRCLSLLSLSAGLLLLALPCAAQPLTYETTEAAAIARAKAEGKMVLTDFGRPGCSDCTGMDSNFQKTSPALKQWILASCVVWKANVDVSNEWQPYASGLADFPLPLCAFVDPGVPDNTLAKYTGLIPATTFMTFVRTQAKKNLPLVVINLPGEPLNTSSFTVQGWARTDAGLSGSVANAAIKRVMWRLNETGEFQPATGTTEWSAQVDLPFETNVFESYVEYEGNKRSWTNKVTLVTANPAVRYEQTITFGTLAPRTFGENPFALAATATSGLPITFTSDNENVAMIAGSTVTIVGAGSANIIASQPGNSQYLPAAGVTRPLTVSKAAQTIAFAPLPERRVGDIAFALGATATSGLPVSYASSNPGVVQIIDGVATVVSDGSALITASQPGDSNYAPAAPVTQTLVVRPLVLSKEEVNSVLSRFWAGLPPAANLAIAAQPDYTFAITTLDTVDTTNNIVFRVRFATDLQNSDWQDVGLQFVLPKGSSSEGYYHLFRIIP